jgi:hypothetical protein
MKRNAAQHPDFLRIRQACTVRPPAGKAVKGEEVAQKKPRDSGENRKEIRKREIIRIGEEEGAWT